MQRPVSSTQPRGVAAARRKPRRTASEVREGSKSPSVVVLAGPNGAGKSTVARDLLQGTLAVSEFVNADAIAGGLSGFAPAGVGFEAGRIMLKRLHELADQRTDFAFETTLASRSFAPWLGRLVSSGYQMHLVFLWLPVAELAVARVADRVAKGGHGIPAEDVRRRYRRGIENFFSLYRQLASSWRLLDGSQFVPRLIAEGSGMDTTMVDDETVWARLQHEHGQAPT
jgi:predicted ABC-type ATPase